MTIEVIAQILQKEGEILKPCLPHEISLFEKTFDVELPQTYKDFLLLMGKGAGKFMLGNSCFFDEIFDLYNGAIEIINENKLSSLPDDAFVFWMHQGYQFAYFSTNETDDPLVYYFSEGKKMTSYKLINNHLSDFFYDQLRVSGILK
jgi:hypothetical protein